MIKKGQPGKIGPLALEFTRQLFPESLKTWISFIDYKRKKNR
jgi:hypothetical protein